MRIAREANTQALADLGIEQALRSLATPREAPKVVHAEVVPESEPLEAEDARRAALRFPRSGVERKTFRAVGALIARAERELSELTGHDISDWTRAESLEQAAKHLREAGVLAGGLASHVRRACS